MDSPRNIRDIYYRFGPCRCGYYEYLMAVYLSNLFVYACGDDLKKLAVGWLLVGHVVDKGSYSSLVNGDLCNTSERL